ncbi:MAG: family transcriptional regulator [Nevskia sp.]|nr:family transcriptional regulator [Nevskia sp.]
MTVPSSLLTKPVNGDEKQEAISKGGCPRSLQYMHAYTVYLDVLENSPTFPAVRTIVLDQILREQLRARRGYQRLQQLECKIENHLEQQGHMPNIGAVLKDEITRISKKVSRQEVSPIKAASSSVRTQLAALKKQVQQLEREVALLRRKMVHPQPSQPSIDAQTVRFSAKGLRSLRQRLDLSAEAFGKLIQVSGPTIYSWEGAKTTPRSEQKAALASLRTIGKREARARLEAM